MVSVGDRLNVLGVCVVKSGDGIDPSRDMFLLSQRLLYGLARCIMASVCGVCSWSQHPACREERAGKEAKFTKHYKTLKEHKCRWKEERRL